MILKKDNFDIKHDIDAVMVTSGSIMKHAYKSIQYKRQRTKQ